jgi:tRNA uridine 5-carboxymethylaminomethyl modification enzyme
VERKRISMEAADRWVRQAVHEGLKLDQWLRRSENSWEILPDHLRHEVPSELWPSIETDFKYEGHLSRQKLQIERMVRQESRRIPGNLDYMTLRGLKNEAQSRFSDVRPATLGQAGRIPGITPADIAMLAVWLEKLEREASLQRISSTFGHQVVAAPVTDGDVGELTDGQGFVHDD